MAGIVSAIGSVAASRFPLPDTATSNSHSFISVNAHARPEGFSFLIFGTRERGRGNRIKWLSKTAIGSVAASRFPLPDQAINNNQSFITECSLPGKEAFGIRAGVG